MCGVWKREPTDLVSLGSREGDESAKPKEYFSSKKPGHSKGEYRYFSAVRKKRLAQQDKADRHTAEDPEMGKTEFLGERGTSVLSIIPERDVCLFHEDDNDQSVYPCPSPLIDRGSDDLEWCCRARRGLTRKHQKPLSVTAWTQPSRPNSI